MTSGSTDASSSMLPSILSIIVRVRSSWPWREPGAPYAAMRWKCTDTPSGANAIISGSTVGFPGGSRKPSRALQPIMLFIPSSLSPSPPFRGGEGGAPARSGGEGEVGLGGGGSPTSPRPSPPPGAEREMSLYQTTPSSRSRFTSSGASPQSPLSKASVCSPSNGGRLTSAGESDNLIGQPTVL